MHNSGHGKIWMRAMQSSMRPYEKRRKNKSIRAEGKREIRSQE